MVGEWFIDNEYSFIFLEVPELPKLLVELWVLIRK